MTMHIGKLTSEVSVQDADVALTPAQIERIVAVTLARLEERAREAQRNHAATAIRRQAAKPIGPGA